MIEGHDQFHAAAALATTVLTINATAKHPGTIDPQTVGAYLAALVEARERSGLRKEDGQPLVENLLHMLWRLADFSAGRPAESTAELVAAFAHAVATEEA
jgi:hypothetical protein